MKSLGKADIPWPSTKAAPNAIAPATMLDANGRLAVNNMSRTEIGVFRRAHTRAGKIQSNMAVE